jgi:hypothetical protein
MSRVLTQERINEIVKRHRPRGWQVHQSAHRWRWESADAHDTRKINGKVVSTHLLEVPTLKDDDSLFLYLHEVGHVVQGHFKLKLPRHREEFEAERFALHVFRNEGIPVTRHIMKALRARLCGSIQYDIKRGIPIQHHIARWAKHNGRS